LEVLKENQGANIWRMKVGSVKGKSISENEKRVIHHFEVKGELRGFTEGKK